MDRKRKGRFEYDEAGKRWFRMARPVIGVDAKGKPMNPHRGEKWGDSWLVCYSTGVRYNGGTIINGKWVQGIKIGPPKLPKSYALQSIGCGLQLNFCPPYATSLLVKKS
jgi:hypothetical protein